MIKFEYDTEAEVPASLKAFYAEAGGKWTLQVEGAVPKKQLDDFRQKGIDQLKEKDAKLAAFEGIDPVKAKELMSREQEILDGKLMKTEGVDALVAKRVEGMKAEFDRKLAAAEQAKAQAEEGLNSVKMDIALRDAGNQHGLRKEAVNDLILRGRGALKMKDGKLVAHGEDGSILYGATGDPMTPAEWVASLTKAAPHLFEPSAGGGAQGGKPGTAHTGPNPWAPGKTNLTEQMKIAKSDPALAERLKAAAVG